MEWNRSGGNEADGEAMGRRSISDGCTDGSGLKNCEGDSRIPLERHTRMGRKSHQKGSRPLLSRTSTGGSRVAVPAREVLSGLV
jgi:hypothetical protein